MGDTDRSGEWAWLWISEYIGLGDSGGSWKVVGVGWRVNWAREWRREMSSMVLFLKENLGVVSFRRLSFIDSFEIMIN